jgi:hypothetical protein
VRITRRRFLAGAAAGAAGAAGAGGIYELVDRLASSPARPAAARRLPREQHLLEGQATITDEGVEVLVPPLHHRLVTARVAAGTDLRAAQAELERRLRELEERFEPTPAGLGVTVGWGLPYFRRHVPGAARAYLPLDVRASRERDRPVGALLDAVRFPSDPKETVLEDNDVAVLLRSDRLDHVDAGAKAIFDGFDALERTSVRNGFVGGGFSGRQSLPKQMAVAAGVAGAELIPDGAQLFLGFTSTQRATLGPGRIANLETLGYAHDPKGYFRGGTAMHVSHVAEDLEAWYLNFDFSQRVSTAFKPGFDSLRPGAQTVRQAPKDVSSVAEVERGYHRFGAIGHSAAIQTSSRLTRRHVAPDGTVYDAGTAIPQRADFNTLDNPFAWSSQPERDRMRDNPEAGVHFVVFNPTSDDFHRNRLAMDGVLPDGTKLRFPPGSRGQGFNAVLRTTHRQNFLVPPRVHGSFPLAELRG